MTATIPCPSCGQPATGNFCNNCGTSLGRMSCPKCGTPVRTAARFCGSCGAAVPGGAGGGASSSRTPWIVAAVAGGALLILLIVMLVRGQPKAPPASAAANAPFASGASGTPPDLSNMSPREQFDRLYNHIMQAAENGDEATVTQFTPMAIQAYANLDSVDADARYHIALLKVHTGDIAAVKAVADTILMKNPGHLFGYMIRGAIARFEKNDTELKKAYADFRSHYDAEMAAKRPEYQEHDRSVAEFKKAAEGN